MSHYIVLVDNKNDNSMRIEKSKISKGDKVTYTKEFMFGKTAEVTATVVAIFPRVALLDNGDEITLLG